MWSTGYRELKPVYHREIQGGIDIFLFWGDAAHPPWIDGLHLNSYQLWAVLERSCHRTLVGACHDRALKRAREWWDLVGENYEDIFDAWDGGVHQADEYCEPAECPES